MSYASNQRNDIVGQPPPFGVYQPPAYNPAYASQSTPYNNPGYGAVNVPITSSQPKAHEIIEEDGQEKFAPGKCRDSLWAALFFGHFITVITLGIVYYSKYKGDINTDSGGSGPNTNNDSNDAIRMNKNGIGLLAIFIVWNILFCITFLKLLVTHARAMVYFSLGFSIVCMAIMCLFMFATGNVVEGVIFLICAGLNVLYVYLVRNRIPFAALMLELVSQIIQKYPSTVGVGVGSVFVQAVWVILWVFSAAFTLHAMNQSDASDGLKGAVYFFFLVSLYWTAQVIKNVVHVTVAGLAASWYFLYPHKMPQDPTLGSFKRATTTSFGSICLGSLIVAVIKAVRAVVNQATKSKNECVRLIVLCLLDCLDRLVQFFNTYAYSQVAIYGKDFCTAAKDTWGLLKSRGLDLVINDDLTGAVLFFGALVGGLLSALIGGLLAKFVLVEEYWGVWALIGGLIGLALTIIVMEVLHSAICALFVCWAESPAALQSTKPEVFERFQNALSTHHSHHYSAPLLANQA